MGFRTIIEPFRIHSVEPLRLTTPEQRRTALREAGYNLFALHAGDTLQDLIHQVRPYEVHKGETDRVFDQVGDDLAKCLRERPQFEILEATTGRVNQYLSRPEKKKLKNTLNTLGKIREHLWGKPWMEALESARQKIEAIEVDRMRIRPFVKITGEFWLQTHEGDGNYNIKRWLEEEGSEVVPPPIAVWLHYLMHPLVRKLENRNSNSKHP